MSEAPKTDHAYDGIEEYDNPLPGWWKWLFIISIVISPFYWVYYHSGTPGRSIHEIYSVAMAENTRLQFEEIGDLKLDEATLIRFMDQPNWVKVGESVFRANCVSCHGREGEGKVGPNLTDESYKNVVQLSDIAKVISNGAGNGAMPKWSNRLHINEVVLVAAYVANLRGTNAEGGRQAEGREIPPWPEASAEETADSTVEGDATEGETADNSTDSKDSATAKAGS